MSSPIAARTEAAAAAPAKGGWLEWSFRLGVGWKGLLGFVQLGVGLALALAPSDGAARAAHLMADHRLAENPQDALARRVLEWAAAFGPGEQLFYTVFLILHGVLMFAVAFSLLRRVHRAYPWALAVLAAFVFYQAAEFVLRHDTLLLFLTCFDLIVIFLVVMEHRRLRPQAPPARHP